jgi:glyoxylase-like metal-dependent hydrolase (beta-lactamase superfamily II)
MGLAQAYLIETERGLIMADAGSRGYEHKVVKLLQKLGRNDLRLIFISHAHLDHYGSAAALRRLTNAHIAIHYLDAKAMSMGETPIGSVRGRGCLVKPLIPIYLRIARLEPTQPDRLLVDDELLTDFGLEARIVHLPGHTPGSACLLVEDRLAFVGDLISTNRGPHVQRYYAHDWSLIPISLARLKALHPECIYPGHGNRPLDGNALQNLSI